MIAVAGLAGAGKTTACRFLEASGLGRRYYAGEVLHDELRNRGLEPNPKNERIVRRALRQAEGKEVFARRALPTLESILAEGHVFLDSAYCEEELNCYRTLAVPIHVLAIKTSRALRVQRLAKRDERKMSEEDLAKRDELELASIGLGAVLADAHSSIQNDGDLMQFEEVVRRSVASFPGFHF